MSQVKHAHGRKTKKTHRTKIHVHSHIPVTIPLTWSLMLGKVGQDSHSQKGKPHNSMTKYTDSLDKQLFVLLRQLLSSYPTSQASESPSSLLSFDFPTPSPCRVSLVFLTLSFLLGLHVFVSTTNSGPQSIS